MILLGSIFHLDFFNVDCRITRSLWKRAIRLFWEQIKYPRCFTAFQRFFSVTRLFVWVYRNASARGIRKRKSGTCLWLRFRKPPSWTFTVILLIISRRRWMLPDRNRNANRQWPIFFRYIPFLTLFFRVHWLIQYIIVQCWKLLMNCLTNCEWMGIFWFSFLGETDICSRSVVILWSHGQTSTKISPVYSATSSKWPLVMLALLPMFVHTVAQK